MPAAILRIRRKATTIAILKFAANEWPIRESREFYSSKKITLWHGKFSRPFKATDIPSVFQLPVSRFKNKKESIRGIDREGKIERIVVAATREIFSGRGFPGNRARRA